MTIGSLIILTALMLILPEAFRPRRRAARLSDGTKPEIHGILVFLGWLNWLYCRIWHQLSIERRAPLPEKGPAILISNHTCGIDHMLLQASSDRVLGFMVAREYYDHFLIHPFCRLVDCIPVNRDGRDFSATRTAIRLLNEGRVLPIFPEGHIVPESGRRIREMKPGTAYLALQSRVPVIPAYIVGTPRTDAIAASLYTPSRSRVVFGEPIDLSDLYGGRPADKTAQTQVSERFTKAFLALQAHAFDVENEGE
jgi:1-acyl-sn-glycerol-3-phosphate acyltransferase